MPLYYSVDNEGECCMEKSFKKTLISIILVVVMVLSVTLLSACTEGSFQGVSNQNSSGNNVTSVEEPTSSNDGSQTASEGNGGGTNSNGSVNNSNGGANNSSGGGTVGNSVSIEKVETKGTN